MVSSTISARAVFAVAVLIGPAQSAAAECATRSTASPAIERRANTPPSFDARRSPLDEFADRHFLTYLQLKENP